MHPSEILSLKVSEDEDFRKRFLAIKAEAEKEGKSNLEYAQDLMPLISEAGLDLKVEDVAKFFDECDKIDLEDDEVDAAAGGYGGCLGVHTHGGTCVTCPNNCVT